MVFYVYNTGYIVLLKTNNLNINLLTLNLLHGEQVAKFLIYETELKLAIRPRKTDHI